MSRPLGTVVVRASWSGAQALWVAAPILGWWPGATARSSQVGWWVVASLLVCCLGMTQSVRRPTRWWAAALAGVLAIFAVHLATGLGWVVAWTYQVSLILLAAWFLQERGEFPLLRRSLLGCAVLQVPLVILQLVGVSSYPEASSGLTGSLYKRAGLSILWGITSLWTTGWRAWVWALLACATGSWTGSVPAVVRLLVGTGRLPVLWPVAALGVIACTWSSWGVRVLTRWQAWTSMEWFWRGWVTGWGFRPFPTGFNETTNAAVLTVLTDHHNGFLDWVGRTGLVGGVLLVGLLWWLRGRLTTPWWRWTAIFLGWCMMWQSHEALPILTLVLAVWVIGLSQEGHHVATV